MASIQVDSFGLVVAMAVAMAVTMVVAMAVAAVAMAVTAVTAVTAAVAAEDTAPYVVAAAAVHSKNQFDPASHLWSN